MRSNRKSSTLKTLHIFLGGTLKACDRIEVKGRFLFGSGLGVGGYLFGLGVGRGWRQNADLGGLVIQRD